MSRLMEFYLYDGNTERGYRLEEIWGWSNEKLEGVHDYIQWLFPTDEPSNFNPDAPLLDRTDMTAFQNIKPLQGNLRRSFAVFLRFLGLTLNDGEIALADNFEDRKWIFECVNHIWLRITRVLRCLRLLGLHQEAAAFFAFLKVLHTDHHLVSPDTMRYWEEAANVPLGGKPCLESTLS